LECQKARPTERANPVDVTERLPTSTIIQIGRGSFDVSEVWRKRDEFALLAARKI